MSDDQEDADNYRLMQADILLRAYDRGELEISQFQSTLKWSWGAMPPEYAAAILAGDAALPLKRIPPRSRPSLNPSERESHGNEAASARGGRIAAPTFAVLCMLMAIHAWPCHAQRAHALTHGSSPRPSDTLTVDSLRALVHFWYDSLLRPQVAYCHSSTVQFGGFDHLVWDEDTTQIRQGDAYRRASDWSRRASQDVTTKTELIRQELPKLFESAVVIRLPVAATYDVDSEVLSLAGGPLLPSSETIAVRGDPEEVNSIPRNVAYGETLDDRADSGFVRIVLREGEWQVDVARLRLSNHRARELDINTADVVLLLTINVRMLSLTHTPCDSQIVSPMVDRGAIFANGVRLWRGTHRRWP